MNISPLIDFRTENPVYIRETPTFPVGYNRAQVTEATKYYDDWNVLLQFLRLYTGRANTYRLYAAQIERFALWMIYARKKGVSGIDRSDWFLYFDHLQAPIPVEAWCSSSPRRFTKQGTINTKWRPFSIRKISNKLGSSVFEYGVSKYSAYVAQRVIAALFNYLIQIGYLSTNPVYIRKLKFNVASPTDVLHLGQCRDLIDTGMESRLIDEIIGTLKHSADNLPEGSKRAFQALRAEYLVTIFADTGMLPSELVPLTMGDIRCNGDKWTFLVTGNRGDVRQVELTSRLVSTTKRFRKKILYSTDAPKINETTPLIPKKNLKSGLSDRQFTNIMRWACQLTICDKHMEMGRHKSTNSNVYLRLKKDIDILENVSPKRLRYTHINQLLTDGYPLMSVMERVGHKEPTTTLRYKNY